MIVKNAIKMTENISGLEALDDGAKVDLILTLTWTLTLTLALTLTLTLALALPWFIFPHWGPKEPARTQQ